MPVISRTAAEHRLGAGDDRPRMARAELFANEGLRGNGECVQREREEGEDGHRELVRGEVHRTLRRGHKDRGEDGNPQAERTKHQP